MSMLVKIHGDLWIDPMSVEAVFYDAMNERHCCIATAEERLYWAECTVDEAVAVINRARESRLR